MIQRMTSSIIVQLSNTFFILLFKMPSMPKQPSKTTNLDSSPAVQLARVKSSNSTIPPISNTSIIQSRIRHTNSDSDVDNNEQAQKRQRTYFIYQPFDSNLAGKNVFSPKSDFRL